MTRVSIIINTPLFKLPLLLYVCMCTEELQLSKLLVDVYATKINMQDAQPIHREQEGS